MGVWYSLVNQTKKEKIGFAHLTMCKKRDITGDSVSASLVTWYLFENQGDRIHFVSDTYEDWPFENGRKEDSFNYPDVTAKYIDALIEQDIFKDNGIEWKDEDEPKTLFIRAIENIW